MTLSKYKNMGVEPSEFSAEIDERLSLRILVISGEWETRGNAMDFQSPSPGGALF